MTVIKFSTDQNTYQLEEKDCELIIDSEGLSEEVITISDILELLRKEDSLSFEEEYYDRPCGVCLEEKSKEKFFKFLEYHFYLYTKDNKIVMSNLDDAYKTTSENQLYKKKKIDTTHIVSINVCPNCKASTIYIEPCDE